MLFNLANPVIFPRVLQTHFSIFLFAEEQRKSYQSSQITGEEGHNSKFYFVFSQMRLEQMARFDIQVLIDQRRGHFFGEGIQDEHPLVLQIGDDLLAPADDFGGRSASIDRSPTPLRILGRIEQLMVFEYNRECKMVSRDCA